MGGMGTWVALVAWIRGWHGGQTFTWVAWVAWVCKVLTWIKKMEWVA